MLILLVFYWAGFRRAPSKFQTSKNNKIRETVDKKLPASQMMDEALTENQLELLLYLTALLLIVSDCCWR